jgi:hypothetical protein
LNDDTKERLQQLDRAFFLALDSKTTKVSLSNTTLTDRLEPTLPVTQHAPSHPFADATVGERSRQKKDHGNHTTTVRTTRFCAICKAPLKSWLVTSFCPQCQPAPLNSKTTSEQNHSIASDDLVSPQERSRSVGGLTASFASRALMGAQWIATHISIALVFIRYLFEKLFNFANRLLAITREIAIRIGVALVFIRQMLEKFSKLHFGLWALLGCTLTLAIVWLRNTQSGGSGFNSHTGGEAVTGIMFGILMKYLLRLLMKYPKWSLGFGSFCLYMEYFR